MASDNIVLVNSTGGARNITLPVPTNGRLLTIKDIAGTSATNNITVLPNAAETIDGASSYVINVNYASVQLTSDGTNWSMIADAKIAGSGTGTVTSVALTVPSFLSVAGSPITTSGTLAVTLATQTANTVFAGPTGGGAAAPTFRALVAADIPSLAYVDTIGTYDSQTPNANGGVISSNSIFFQSATASVPGMVSTGTQTLAGAKTLTGNTLIAQATAAQATIGISGSTAQHQINGGLVVTTNTVSANYSIT